MKKLLLTLFAVLTASFAFAGNGTKENPYTVADIQAMDVNNLATEELVWVKAYISGSADNKLSAFITTTTGAVASNLMLSDAQSETDYTKCVPAQLASKSAARTALNLIDNPTNLGKTLLVSGKIQKYFGVAGIKEITEWELSGEGTGGDEGGGGDDDKPDFSQYEELSVSAFLEKKDTQTKFKLTGIVGQIKNTTYGNFNLIDLDNEDVYVYVYGLVDYKGTKKIWGTLDPKIEEKDTITIVGSYTLYNETTDEIVDAIYVEHKKYTGDKVDIKNTPETAYTMAKVKELVDAGEGLGDEVYVKGIVSELGTITAGGTGTYFIKDNLSDEFSVQVYKGNYLENHPFDTAEDLKVGDEVIVYGLITLYNTTYEVNSGNYIYSLNGETKYQPKDLVDISNTPETAYTVSEAISKIEDAQNDLTKEVYTKGVITSIKSIDVSKYERAQYYIGETQDAEQTIQVYNGYYLNGVAFTADDQIKPGDEVIVFGKLTKFKDTYEIDQNNYIYSLNGITDGIRNIEVAKSGVIYDLAGRRVEKATKGIYIINGRKVVF